MKEFSQTRMGPQLRAYEETRRMIRKQNLDLVLMADGSWISFLSGTNEDDVQMRDAETVIADEPAQYQRQLDKALDAIVARTRTYDKTTAKRLFIGTPEEMFSEGETPTDYYRFWLESDQREWFIKCPECGESRMFNRSWFESLKLEDCLTGGKPDKDKFLSSVKFVCPFGCGLELEETSRNRREVMETGHYIVQNPAASSAVRGFPYSGFASPWTGWGDLLWKWRCANWAAQRGGITQLKEVIRKDWGEFWDPKEHRIR